MLHALILALLAPHAASPPVAPALADTLRFGIVYQLKPAGELRIWRNGTNELHVVTEYNDRGRGPHTHTRVHTSASGMPEHVVAGGRDYWKNPVDVEIAVDGDSLRWRSGEQSGVHAHSGGFYLPRWDAYASRPLLARLALATGHAGVTVMPDDSSAVTVHIRALHSTRVLAGSDSLRVTLHALSWGGRTHETLWLDDDGELFAWSGWRSVVRRGSENSLPLLIALEDSIYGIARRAAAESLMVRPTNGLAITNARVVDVEQGTVRPSTTVLIDGNRIARVVPDGDIAIPAGARVIDAGGGTLLPGLWEMHGHFGGMDDGYGRRQLAQGVTSVRDLLSLLPTTHLQIDRRRDIDAGREVGPRLVMAGFIDGPHANAGPTVVLIDNERDARAAVRDYASRGYDGGIKLYSSLDPTLVPAIVQEAARHGMRVGGHIPAFLTAERAVLLGFGEINHGNFLILNFFGDTLDTRGTARFSVVAEQAHALDLSSPAVASFVRLVHERDVVIDPTLCIFRNQLVTNQTLPLSPGITRDHHRMGYERMRDLVGMMHRAGVRIVAGTDNSCPLAEELEIYGEVGMTAMQVLRMATLDAAASVGRDTDLGSIAEGKLADLILVDGDPLAELSALRNVRLVVKNGVPLEPEELRRPMPGP